MLPIHGFLTDNDLEEYLDYTDNETLKLRALAFSARLPLTPAVFVTSQTVQLFFDHRGLLNKIVNLIDQTNTPSPQTFDRFTKTIQSLIIKHPFPPILTQGFHRVYDCRLNSHPVLMSPLSAGSAYQPFLSKPIELCYGDAAILTALRQFWSESLTPMVLRQLALTYPAVNLSLPLVGLFSLPSSDFSGTLETFLSVPEKSPQLARLSLVSGYSHLFSDRDISPQTYILDRQNRQLLSRQTVSQTKSLVLDRHHRFQIKSLKPSLGLPAELSPNLINQTLVIAQKLNHLLLRPCQVSLIGKGQKLKLFHVAYLSGSFYSYPDKSNQPPSAKTVSASLSVQPPGSSGKLATQVYLKLSDPQKAKPLSLTSVDGVCAIDGDWIRRQVWSQTKNVSSFNQNYPSFLNQTLAYSASLFGQRPVYYGLAVQSPSAMSAVKNKPITGDIISRLISDPPETQIELKALARIRHLSGCRQIQLLLPPLNSKHQFISLKRLAAAYGLVRSPSFKLGVTLASPAALHSVQTLFEVGLDLAVIDFDRIALLYLGETHDPIYHPGLSAFITRTIASRPARLPVLVKGAILTAVSDYILDLVESGVTGIITGPSTVPYIRDRLAFAEARLVSKS